MSFTKWTLKCLITAQMSIFKLPKTPPRLWDIAPSIKLNLIFINKKLVLINNLLLHHVGLCNVLDLAVHLVIFLARWIGGSS